MDIIVRDGDAYVAFTHERIEAMKAAIKLIASHSMQNAEILQAMVNEAELESSWEAAIYIDDDDDDEDWEITSDDGVEMQVHLADEEMAEKLEAAGYVRVLDANGILHMIKA